MGWRWGTSIPMPCGRSAGGKGLCTNVSHSQWQRYGRRVTGGVNACENAEIELTHRKFAHRRAWDQTYP